MKNTYSLAAGARHRSELIRLPRPPHGYGRPPDFKEKHELGQLEQMDFEGEGNWLGLALVILIIIGIVAAAMYGYSQYTSVLK